MKYIKLTLTLAIFFPYSLIFAQKNNTTTTTTEYYEVVFGVYEGVGGTVTAEGNGEQISSGDTLIEGSTIVFTCVPDENYEICAGWWYNGALAAIPTLVVEESYLEYDIEVLADLCSPESNQTIDNNLRKLEKIYPNPSKGRFVIDVNKPTNVSIYNSSGICVFKCENSENTIEITDLPTGLYFVKLEYDNKAIVEKVIIK